MFSVFNWFYERSDFSLDAFDAIHRLQCRVRTTKEMCEKNKKMKQRERERDRDRQRENREAESVQRQKGGQWETEKEKKGQHRSICLLPDSTK